MDKKPLKRKWIQLMSALLYNANLKGFVEGGLFKGAGKGVCVPGLNCYSCPGAVGACPLGSLQNALYSRGGSVPFYILGTLLLFGLLLGRIVCGFLCPFGLIQELLYKIPSKKLKKSRWTKRLTWIKYVLLAVLVLAIPALLAYPAFCKYVCPAGTLEGGVLQLLLDPSLRAAAGGLFLWKAGILLAVIVGAVFVFRIFCRFLCPLGAIYSLFSRLSLFGVETDHGTCIGCDKCQAVCHMDIHRPGDRECICCGDCVAVCPVSAIHWKGRKAEKEKAV